MKILLFTLILGSVGAHAACNKRVDPSKIILFVDTNDSDMEIDTAEKAACSRGETVVVVPKNYKEYKKYSAAVKKNQEEAKGCDIYNPAPTCKDVVDKLKKSYSELANFQASQPRIQSAIKDTLKEIKDKNGKLQSLIISGHNGGGRFGGDKGSFSRHDFAELLKAKDLEGINQIKSLLLLGCYTGVQNEMGEWKQLLPEVKLIGGYDDSAPLSTRPQGHKYLSELLTKEKALLKQADEKKLQSFAEKNISSMFTLNSAVYLQCEEDESGKAYYYGSKKAEKKFSILDLKGCEDARALADIRQRYQSFNSGELEPPTNTATGELRQLYNKARALEHCFQDGSVDVNHIFNLLFYGGVKKSFAAFYKKDLEKVEKELAELTVEDMEKHAKPTIDNLTAHIKQQKENLESMEKDPQGFTAKLEKDMKEASEEQKKIVDSEAYKKLIREMSASLSQGQQRQMSEEETKLYRKAQELGMKARMLDYQLENFKANPAEAKRISAFQIKQVENQRSSVEASIQSFKTDPDKLKSIWIPTEKNLANKSRKELMENVHKLNGLLATQVIPAKQASGLSFVNTIVNQHLVYFSNPFSWHEYNGASVEKPARSVTLDQFQTGGGLYGGFGGYMGTVSPMGGGMYGGMTGGSGGR